jgi:hypothetical protein
MRLGIKSYTLDVKQVHLKKDFFQLKNETIFKLRQPIFYFPNTSLLTHDLPHSSFSFSVQSSG